jgi:hypothetical protein
LDATVIATGVPDDINLLKLLGNSCGTKQGWTRCEFGCNTLQQPDAMVDATPVANCHN